MPNIKHETNLENHTRQQSWLDIFFTAGATFALVFIAYPLHNILQNILFGPSYTPDDFGIAALSAYLSGFTILATQRLIREGRVSNYLFSKLPEGFDWEIVILLANILIALVLSVISMLGFVVFARVTGWFISVFGW